MRVYKIIVVSIIMLLVVTSCTRIGSTSNVNEQNKKQVAENQTETQNSQNEPCLTDNGTNKQSVTINIFIENSGSMNGYINQSSNFQVALGKHIALLKHNYGFENIKLYYINRGVYPQAYSGDSDGLIDFARGMFAPNNFKNVGNTQSTELNEIMENALKYVDENSISIVISDCIYSVSGTGTSETLLGIAGTQTMDKFLDKTKNIIHLATSIIQLTSNFNGNYYDYMHPNNGFTINCERPYYMIVLGTHKNVIDYVNNIDVTKMDGFKNQYTISNYDISNIKASIMNKYGKYGQYRIVKESNSSEIKTIKDVNILNGSFKLAIGIDLSSTTMSENDKTDINNYTIDGNYRITNIEKNSGINITDPKDKEIVAKNHLTHFVHVESIDFPNDFKITIKRETPSWVNECSSIDDTNIATDYNEQTKTFGLSYFVGGISDAYSEMSNNKNITINFNIE